MKKIIRKIKNWLIDKLGGYTKEDMNLLYKSEVAVRKLLLQAWADTVQEHDWCCDYCAENCDKHNGWCRRFEPKIVI